MASHSHREGHQQSQDHEHGHRHAEEDMLSVEEAFQRIMASFSPLEAEDVSLLDCLGQVLAEDIQSPLDLPPLSNSAMDGYAVLSADIQGASPESPRNLEVIGLVAAGQVSNQTVVSGVAIRIMTGAPIPAGADAVVPFEETDEVERRQAGRPLDQVAIYSSLPVGVNVRPAGEDVRRGQQVLDAGTPIRPAEIGVMASLGLTSARVIRRPVVSILATGDELVASGRSLEEGKIFDSNSVSVAGSVLACGGIPRVLGIARDNLEDLNNKLTEAAGSDLIVTSAGVSKGDYDIVKDVLTERGDMNFWSVRMRLEMFARPAIRIMLGKRILARPMVEGVLTAPIHNADGRRVYARVEVTRKDGMYYANPVGPQGSNILTSMSKANGLAVCPDNLPSKGAGEQVQIIMLDWNEEVDV